MLTGNSCFFKLPYFQNARTSHRLLLLAKQLYYHLLRRLAGLPDRIHWTYSDFHNNCTFHKLAFAFSYLKNDPCLLQASWDRLKTYNSQQPDVKIFVCFQLLDCFCREINRALRLILSTYNLKI